MAQNVTVAGASYSDVPSVVLPKTGGGSAEFIDTTISSNAATASDILSGKLAWVNGTLIEGTGTGGGGVGAVTQDANGYVVLDNGEPYSQDINITDNGTYNVAGYGHAIVTVSGGSPTIDSLTVTPTTSQQTFNSSSVDGYKPVVVNAMPSGTAGTPTASKGAVSNHSVSVTPSVTNTTGYITGSTKTGTAVTVSASELVSGNKEITANGTNIDVANFSTVSVTVPSGTSKNVQVVQGTTRTNSSTATAVGASLTVSKTGTYDIYWSGFRSNTSSSYTWATQLYIGGTAYGSENTTWSNNQQNNHLSNVSLTANQTLRVYARQTRGTSYYMYAPTLVIVEA